MSRRHFVIQICASAYMEGGVIRATTRDCCQQIIDHKLIGDVRNRTGTNELQDLERKTRKKEIKKTSFWRLALPYFKVKLPPPTVDHRAEAEGQSYSSRYTVSVAILLSFSPHFFSVSHYYFFWDIFLKPRI